MKNPGKRRVKNKSLNMFNSSGPEPGEQADDITEWL